MSERYFQGRVKKRPQLCKILSLKKDWKQIWQTWFYDIILFIFLNISLDLGMSVLSFLETFVLSTSHQTGFQNQYVLSPLSICKTNPRNGSERTHVSQCGLQTGWLSPSSFSSFRAIKIWRKYFCPQTMQEAYTQVLPLFAVVKGNCRIPK